MRPRPIKAVLGGMLVWTAVALGMLVAAARKWYARASRTT